MSAVCGVRVVHNTADNERVIRTGDCVSAEVVDMTLRAPAQKVLQFQSLGTLIATSAGLFPGVVGLALDMALMGLTGAVRLPCKRLCCWCWARSVRPILDATWLLFRARQSLKSP